MLLGLMWQTPRIQIKQVNTAFERDGTVIVNNAKIFSSKVWKSK